MTVTDDAELRTESLAHLPHLKEQVAEFFASFPAGYVFNGAGPEMLIHDLSMMVRRLEKKLTAAQAEADITPSVGKHRLYLVEAGTHRVLASSDDARLCEQVKQAGDAIDPTGKQNIRISFAFGNETL